MTTSPASAFTRATIAVYSRSTLMRSGSCSPCHARFAFAPRRPGPRFSISERRMQIRPVILGLAAVWLVPFVASFVSLQVTDVRDGDQSGLARTAVFLTWQVIAFVVAMLGAFTTRLAVARGAERVKVFGYVPLALSVFLVASFVALVAFRIWVLPLFQ